MLHDVGVMGQDSHIYIYILVDSHISPYGESVVVQRKSFREKAEPNVFLSEEDRAERQRDRETERPRGRVRSRPCTCLSSRDDDDRSICGKFLKPF
jgi:hypothetical protein